jgi:hypothetical protein
MYSHRRKVRCLAIEEGATHRAFSIRRIEAWVAPPVDGDGLYYLEGGRCGQGGLWLCLPSVAEAMQARRDWG